MTKENKDNNGKEELENYIRENCSLHILGLLGQRSDDPITSKDFRYFVTFIYDLISQEKEKWIAEKVKQLTPPEEWKQCLKIGTGQDEMCVMCGFNPKELINLLQK